MQDRY